MRRMNTPPPGPRAVIETEETEGSPSAIRMKTEQKIRLPPHFDGLASVFRESYITTEYCMVANRHKLGGLYVIPSQQSAVLWFGILFVHHGPYQGGVFRFTLQFADTYPDTLTVPTVRFEPPVFHPSIHATRGTFDLRRHFKSWNKTQNHVWQVLKVVRGAFYKIEGSTLNKTANDLYENDPGLFVSRVQRDVEASQSRLYETPEEFAKDAHWIKFSPYEARLHDPIRAKALQPVDKLNSTFKNVTNRTAGVVSPRGTSFMV